MHKIKKSRRSKSLELLIRMDDDQATQFIRKAKQIAKDTNRLQRCIRNYMKLKFLEKIQVQKIKKR